MTARSPWRTRLYDVLATMTLGGKVLDLGGSRKSAYVKNFKGDFEYTVANLEGEDTRDIVLNLEEPFSMLETGLYDYVLGMNVLEHIYNYQNVVAETQRILKPGGTAIFAVPFLIQVHPSPNDHWRYTKQTLERLFGDAGFSRVTVESVGSGAFGAAAQLLFGIIKIPLLRYLVRIFAETLDSFIAKFSFGKNYSKEFYPLGYIITVTK